MPPLERCTNANLATAEMPSSREDFSRRKDRISYSHQMLQIDLTQVGGGTQTTTPVHELEIEFKDARLLLQQAALEDRQEPNNYLEMVQVFLNNIRISIPVQVFVPVPDIIFLYRNAHPKCIESVKSWCLYVATCKSDVFVPCHKLSEIQIYVKSTLDRI